MTAFAALGFDPAPGRHSSAQSVAAQVRTTATSIREAADVLGGTGRQDWTGETATAFHETMSGELTPRVVTAADSFETAAAALETWAESLLGFQSQAEELERRAQAALTDVTNASDDLSAAQASDDPEADVDGASTRLDTASGTLEAIRGEAYTLADTYAGEAEYVASCLADAADAAPSSSLWDSFTDWLADVEDWFQDYVLPVLEDIITVLAVVAAVVAIAAMIANPMGWAALAALAPLIGKIAFGLAVAGVVVDGLQFAGGREDGTEFLVGLAGLGLGAATGPLMNGIRGVAGSGGGLAPAMAGTYGGTGGSALVGALGMQWNSAGAIASSTYVGYRLYDQASSVRDTAESLNDVGSPIGRMVERFRNLFDSGTFTTAEQQRDIASRQEDC